MLQQVMAEQIMEANQSTCYLSKCVFFFFSLFSYPQDDDIVFEDFARLRLKGLKDDKEDDEAYC